ncbi:bifunctional cytochrome P450/NADPH--P450 reductase [Aestuariivita boseongensis]|uniref:bifunctional cytochrome P450/NADPH--P450 reductase n=1 Tax=Aestuariivita boseongensis TaxID=1470562 RepID=UPI000680E3C4|nr:cytochrome P450 [Aestuariivita boseongensis]
MAEEIKLERIPMPDRKPVVGNMLSVDKDQPLQSLMQLTRELGPIIRMDMMGTPLVVVSGFDLVDELCDETRFDKAVRGSLRRVRAIGGDGLFTGDTQEPNWSKAHNILLPTFSRQAMSNYFPMMLDVAGQLCLKWERLNADDDIDIVHDMTAVALDTIGICGFNYRFNSFYRQDYHPFINALTNTLETCMMQRGLPFESTLLKNRLDQMEKDVGYMNKLVDDIIAERRKGGDRAVNDLLNYMLEGVDKVTGDSLSDENIRYQINTFLIAGHETTSGLMSFTLHFLMNHPDVLEKAYEEVDRVFGRDISVQPTLKQVNQLQYVQQVILEALRLWPTAPAFSVYPYKDEIIGGKYKLKERTFTTVLTLMLHRDKSVWGEDAEKFNPDNFSREAVAERPVNAYKPFGNGQRACIGRQFAMQEAVLVIGMILQRFELIDHTNWKFKIKESMSIKPDNLRMKVRLRKDIVRSNLVPGSAPEASGSASGLTDTAKRPSHGTPALILYGSNLGTTEDYARDLARTADLNGFDVTLAELDDYAGKLPKTGAVMIACASYNGAPPDNAVKFVDWLEGAEDGAAAGVKYAVFGCGHSDWAATFQATPRAIDRHLERLGASRITDRAEGDARDDIDEQFDAWATALWPAVGSALSLDMEFANAADAAPLYQVERLTALDTNPVAQQSGAKPATITENRELQNVEASGRSTRHIEVALPEGTTYRTGDHLSVVPVNSDALVGRVLDRFGFSSDAQIRIQTSSDDHSQLPVDTPLSVHRLLAQMLELQSVASRRDVATLARYTECPRSAPALKALAEDDYKSKVQQKRLSVLDLLEEFPACELPFGVFLELMPMLTPRYYSISSSALVDQETCSVTVGVVDEPAISGRGRFKGVCSNYLAEKGAGKDVQVSIRSTSDGFRLPDDPTTPVIMVGPGTGIAPFRGFLAERARLKADGKTLGPAILFFGCRHPDQDFIYREELEGFAKDGVADLKVAFSRAEKKKVYVQDLIREERDQIWEMIQNGARIFVCGDGSRMEPDVRRALSLLYSEEMDVGAEAADAWMDQMSDEGRYVLDVWVSN